jgi:glycosyltransferase involved in cell wall biosynthesis
MINKKTPKVSVIMPAYNSEKYIGEAIESILNQTFTDFEFIILNDGSTDNTAKIIKEYAKKDKRIRFINNKKNRGIVGVLNQGLDLATGKYIARMDSDDISLPERFEKQIKYMEQHPECGVLGTWFHMFGNKDYIITNRPKILDILKILHGYSVGHPTVMIRKSVIDKYEFRYKNDYKYCEDYELWSRMIFVTEIHNLQEVLLNYRWSGDNISVVHSEKQQELTEKVRQNILNKITQDKNIQDILKDLSKGFIKQGILLPKWLGKICCLFIPKQKNRHAFNNKYVKGN